MKLTFSIDYRTNWGESVYLMGNIMELGGNIDAKAIKMAFDGGSRWSVTIALPETTESFTYGYIVRNEQGTARTEWWGQRTFTAVEGVSDYELIDSWQEFPADKPLYSSAFTRGIFSRGNEDCTARNAKGNLVLKINAPYVKRNQVLAVSGSCDSLGNWNPEKAVRLCDCKFPEWQIAVKLKAADVNVEYKFLLLDKETGNIVAWENRDNRVFANKGLKKNEMAIVSGLTFANPQPNWRGAGTAIPVFSLRSADDFGVGDFYDLFKMVDWAALTEQKMLQILPINDTTMTHTWTDSYPYNANSTFALHPMFLRPEAIGTLSDKAKLAEYRRIAEELNALPQIDYERVNNTKMAYVRDLFAEFGEATMATDDYKQFIERNNYWLKPYAAFCVLRDQKGTADFKQWAKYATYEPEMINRFCDDNAADINFNCFCQYHLDKQLRAVRDYAHSKGVVLKGDIPIGISRTSVDAWVSPQLFYMDCQAGAPPDDFSVQGQNWGFPTYNWEEMNKDGFQWWKNRFKKMAEYFDAYRIDHILGFFRIWQIPMKAVHGLLGTFNPALPFSADELRNSYDFWINKDWHTSPYIMDYFLGDFFGEYTEEVKSTFLYPKGDGRYGLQEFVDTQRKVEAYFADKEKNDKNNRIKEALMGLIDEVLFIEDSEQKDMYHPRISAQFTYIYRSLTDYEKWCFDRLYNDFFYHRHNDFWYGKAMWKLPPLINATDMLVCGEDLGMIPDCVASVMNSQKILSLEIQRMPKDPTMEFGDTYRYPYYSVCTTSTHDMPGIRAWWEDNREKTQHFFNNTMHENGAAPYFAEPWICDRIITMHLESPAMLTVLPLQDWLSIDGVLRRENPADEQINVPANPRHYWRYRMHLSLEDLLNAETFNNYLRDKIIASGR